ncbi:hypothetical protein D3C71_2212670 [compost metagenome]
MVTLSAVLLMSSFSKLPPVAESILTVKCSVPSVTLSLMVGMVNVAWVLLALITTVATPV